MFLQSLIVLNIDSILLNLLRSNLFNLDYMISECDQLIFFSKSKLTKAKSIKEKEVVYSKLLLKYILKMIN